MSKKQMLFLSLILFITISCEKKSDEKPLDKLVQSLESELNPLSEDPLRWSNDDLNFLDPIANKSIIGLGEATHELQNSSKLSTESSNILLRVTVIKFSPLKPTSESHYSLMKLYRKVIPIA